MYTDFIDTLHIDLSYAFIKFENVFICVFT